MFVDESIEIPQLDATVKDLLLARASDNFDWSEISPTIFGAVFESTLNPETRRSGGMHYTSIENIHKVVDPLFLDALKAEFAEIKELKILSTRNRQLGAFQQKLASLTVLDPACGSGNFLTETYLSLRRLENEILATINAGQMLFDLGDVIKVNIGQFYGIEINDFAVTVAKTALWIAESQMMKATEDIVHKNLDFLPLKSYANIVEGNALHIDWNTVVPNGKLTYIMGNPPFVGKKEQSKEQKAELTALFNMNAKGGGNLDYVTGWYVKAVQYMQGTAIHAAFVATNSITQGEQVSSFWKPLFEHFSLRINFAYRTFRWDSEASIKAHVHCVIIGFNLLENATEDKQIRTIYDENGISHAAKNINAYLTNAPNIFIAPRTTPLCAAPPIAYGSMPIDDGHLILTKDDVNKILAECAENKEMIREYAGGIELLRNQKRWCLWLVGISPSRMQKSSIVMNRIKQTEEFRRKSNRPQTLALADYPTLFGEIRQPTSSMLVIPKVSSEKRSYIPIAFVAPEIIINGSTLIVAAATLYHFGILHSNVHNAWMRAVCGRLEMRYQYSNNIVYNNFPWPEATDAQKTQIEATAQQILDARALYPDCSLADLYDETVMPPELRKAHHCNDHAVMKAYGFAPEMTEPEMVAMLMNRYQVLATVSNT